MTEYDDLAVYYDSEWKELKDDIPFLVEECKKSGAPVLELACGSGRIGIPIAQEGIEVWGLDNAKQMLDLFEENLKDFPTEIGKRVHLVKAGMENFKIDKKFKLIIIPFNSFLLMTDRKDMDKCLTLCREHLAPDGKLIIDVYAPSFELCAEKVPQMKFIKHFFDAKRERTIIQWEYAQRDMSKQIINMDLLYEEYDKKGNVVQRAKSLSMSVVFRYELQYLLEKNGFEITEFYGNYDRSEFTQDSVQMIYVGKPL